MAVSTVTVCDKRKIRILRGLPDCYYPICAVLDSDTIAVKALYHEGGEEPAQIDTAYACRKLGCPLSDLVIVAWRDDIGEAFGGAPWVHDVSFPVCIPCADEDDDIRIVDDFADLF